MKSDRKLFWKSPWGDLFLFFVWLFLFVVCGRQFFDPEVCSALDIAFSNPASTEALVFEGSVAGCGLLFVSFQAGPSLYSAIHGFIKSKYPATPSEEVSSDD